LNRLAFTNIDRYPYPVIAAMLSHSPISSERQSRHSKETNTTSAFDSLNSGMPQVSHCTVVEMLFTCMASSPNTLLSHSIFGIKQIWMSLELDMTGLAQSLLLGVMVGPGKKLSSRLLATFQHIAAVVNRKGTKNGFHDAWPRFDDNIL
jgi:hypothetical protein